LGFSVVFFLKANDRRLIPFPWASARFLEASARFLDERVLLQVPCCAWTQDPSRFLALLLAGREHRDSRAVPGNKIKTRHKKTQTPTTPIHPKRRNHFFALCVCVWSVSGARLLVGLQLCSACCAARQGGWLLGPSFARRTASQPHGHSGTG
jgi:hypothetical protein